MENKKKKIVLITVSILILTAIASVGGYSIYKQNKIKERSAEVEADIADNWKIFVAEEDRNKKLETFKKLSTNKSSYQEEKYPQKEVLDNFENVLEKMKTFFSKDYEKIISENTLTDVEKISDKVAIATAKENLEQLLNTIKNENDTLKLKKIEEKTTIAQDLIEKYTNRIKTLEEEEAKKKAEEEAKKKAEEEAKKKAEEEAVAQAQNNIGSNSNDGIYDSGSNSSGGGDYNSGSSSNSGGSSSSNNSSSSSGRYVVERYTFTDSNGVTTTKITYSDGTIEFVHSDGTVEDITGNGDIFG